MAMHPQPDRDDRRASRRSVFFVVSTVALTIGTAVLDDGAWSWRSRWHSSPS
jgi:hypothetical protein